MSLELFQTCLSKLPREAELDFGGMCEPFINPDCGRMIRLALERGNPVTVFTTTQGMTRDDVETLKLVPANRISLHLPDDSGRMNLEVTDRYLETLKECARPGCHFSFFGKINHRVAALFGWSTEVIGSWPSSRAGNVAELAGRVAPGPIRCQRGVSMKRNVLLPSGDVVLCCMDYALKHVLGNLVNQNYADLHRSPEYLRVIAGQLDPSMDILCRTCELAESRVEL
jgi:hypothetical protein